MRIIREFTSKRKLGSPSIRKNKLKYFQIENNVMSFMEFWEKENSIFEPCDFNSRGTTRERQNFSNSTVANTNNS